MKLRIFATYICPVLKCCDYFNKYLFCFFSYMDDHFAVAINIPAEKCSSGVKPDQNFLPNDSAWKVKRALNRTARVYRGRQLIGARPKPINGTIDYHPEYLLLIQSNPPKNTSFDPLLKNLLNRDKNGCVIFYTFKSPCVDTCSTPEGQYSIIPALNLLQMHKGPKAFVFSKVWKQNFDSVPKKDAKRRAIARCYRIGPRMYGFMSVWEGQEKWHENILKINARVPLYRCDSSECISCLIGWEVDGRCVHNRHM